MAHVLQEGGSGEWRPIMMVKEWEGPTTGPVVACGKVTLEGSDGTEFVSRSSDKDVESTSHLVGLGTLEVEAEM